jgi:DNA-binding LacI/PurR family transcriptional regulator
MVTIIDVAKHAGVSKTTVSAVLNKGPHIKEETRKRVEAAIDELGYVCNHNARGLRKRETKCLGVINITERRMHRADEMGNVTDLFGPEVTNGIQDGLDGTDYGLITERFYLEDAQDGLPQIVKNARVDGVFLLGNLSTYDIVQKILQRGIPVIGVNCKFDGIDCVINDVEQGAYLQAKELLDSGCKKIALINCSPMYSSCRERRQGWKRAIEEADISEHNVWHAHCRENTRHGGYDALKELWDLDVRPDGIVTATEKIAFGVMQFLAEQGIGVPKDVSVVSYSASVLGLYSIPPMTSVNVHRERMGMAAAKMMLRRIEHPEAPIELKVIEPDMVIRESVRKK